ncbi:MULTISPECIES: fumarate hydratase [Carboxydocella]|uniref:Fumarate hydratase subunit alpha n=2 Tax=Carboxydocella TaxID=178898 RepID=A0A1T4LWF8_9FIRM|nr:MULTISPECIES: fumarate hydratase [Carboxydocella]AVX20647.1 fumarate hydratase subunit alpha [Carboxydocella thermautotrophica]AVX31069.1 fumarate hydratase subunit alpha [Carboxydocella thermautotrophica]SJZ58971.1 fumarate hydratase subunit alpha [Carboxydocella sporoproducens DSM 16521]GAW27969.1 fumarate hydratase [Carboxydocella sp. ULO1]GAW32501.1 fumarate hydratase [Carboxydocella sp. JDF658]
MTIREIHVDEIRLAVANLVKEANYFLPEDVENAIKKATETEQSPNGKEILNLLLQNAQIAREEQMPICQDTGFAVIFVELGQDVHITGGDLITAINEGVRSGYVEGYLRKSIVGHPLERVNTKDNTPAVIHLEIVPGSQLKIVVAPKGGGSENMSALKMLKPADGITGVKKFVLETVKNAGPNPCPPIIVGVGIGGTFEKCALLAKKALLRPVGSKNPDKIAAELEEQLLQEINSSGIGPQGLGGKITALAVHIELYAAHIASLPVAVNINCHAARHKEIVL